MLMILKLPLQLFLHKASLNENKKVVATLLKSIYI